MTERLDLFPTPVLKVTHPDADSIRAPLLEAVQARRGGGDAGVARSNVGGWHSDTGLYEWGGAPARAIVDFAIATVSPLMFDGARGGQRSFRWAVEMWANVNPPGASNEAHCHTGSFWSGVYYLDPGVAAEDDAGGELVLEDPRFPMAYMTVPDLYLKDAAGSPMTSQTRIRPAPGLLVLFPSWLRHGVRPHDGPGERVSIALNLILRPPPAQ